MGLISEKLNNMLCEIIGECFATNRMLDRGMSLLDTKFAMKNTATLLHPNLAHVFLGAKFADGVGDYIGSRNNLVYYPATPIGDKDYNTPLDFVKDYYNYMMTLQTSTYDAIDEAVEEGDYATKVFLDGLVNNIVEYTDIAQTLVDVFGAYGSNPINLQLLDANIDKHIHLN